MRRPTRLTLAAVAAVLPLTLASCAASTDDNEVRSENGSEVDGKSPAAEGEDGDQSDTDDQEDEG